VWSDDGRELLLMNGEAMRRPLPDTQRLAARSEDAIVSFTTAAGTPMRVMSGRSYVCPCVENPQSGALIGNRRVTVQVARSEEPMRQQVRDLLLILVLGLPLAVGVAGLGGYVLASRALAPIEQMTARARTITAERLGDRLPVANPENEMGRLATVFNETLGRLEASFDQMRRFTADVSHELRTPLTAIRSVGEVGLRGHRDEAAYRGIIGSMLEEVDRLASLVDRLLTLSRAETGQAGLSRDAVDLSALADDVVSHLAVLAEEKRQTLSVDRQASLVVQADRLVLRQALINLVDNAIKFTPASGHVRIRIDQTPQDAVVDVIDSGPGISSEAREHIFDRFYRENESNGSGSGLGLSLAKGAVEALGGHLTLVSTGATGSAFRITLPR
jgi:heavy metal sensor kinase